MFVDDLAPSCQHQSLRLHQHGPSHVSWLCIFVVRNRIRLDVSSNDSAGPISQAVRKRLKEDKAGVVSLALTVRCPLLLAARMTC